MANTMKLPFEGLRVVELDAYLISGRLTGMLFADQGAEVVILSSGKAANSKVTKLTDGDEVCEKRANDMLNRNKIRPLEYTTDEGRKILKGADVLIVDGDTIVPKETHQIVLHVVAALPGDKVFGHLPHDCDEGLLLALTGFFTDMALSWFLDRPVIYTPLKICSIYAGIIGSVATAAALIDRNRNGGIGRDIHASRLAGGLSAIGALSLGIGGPALPKHLESVKVSHIRQGITSEEMDVYIQEATNNPLKQLWLEQRLFPFGAPYHSQDGTLILPMATFNRRMARRLCDQLGIWDDLSAKGIVDADPFVSENDELRVKNLGLPMNFSWQVSSAIAESLSQIFKKKTAIEWEKELSSKGVVAVRVQSFKEWMADEDAQRAKISAEVKGLEGQRQVGRTAFLKQANGQSIAYPNLQKLREINHPNEVLDLTKSFQSTSRKTEFHAKPLEGFVVVDFSNVLAGPNCGRMLGELGATVYKVEPHNPQHPPMVMVTWQAEGNAGKKTIIVDFKSEEGKKVALDLVKLSDFVLINKSDGQVEHMGLDRATLDQINAKSIHLNVQARRGENIESESGMWPGYDPALQGKTGLSYRFGPTDCPTLHGVASCVDYATAYMGSWAGLIALWVRETQGVSKLSSGTSLALTASLMQFTHLGDGEGSGRMPPQGPKATGPTTFTRTYKLAKTSPEKWVYVVADCDLSYDFANVFNSLEEALANLTKRGFLAVEVMSCKTIAEKSLTSGSITACCEEREKNGLLTKTWKPTWICYGNQPLEHPGAVGPTGCDREEILTSVLGYEKNCAEKLLEDGAVRQDYWIDCKN